MEPEQTTTCRSCWVPCGEVWESSLWLCFSFKSASFVQPLMQYIKWDYRQGSVLEIGLPCQTGKSSKRLQSTPLPFDSFMLVSAFAISVRSVSFSFAPWTKFWALGNQMEIICSLPHETAGWALGSCGKSNNKCPRERNTNKEGGGQSADQIRQKFVSWRDIPKIRQSSLVFNLPF